MIKIILHQAIFSPILYTLFFIYTGLFDGNIEQVPDKIKKQLPQLLIAQLKVWPLALVLSSHSLSRTSLFFILTH
jgi:hypothetical protein